MPQQKQETNRDIIRLFINASKPYRWRRNSAIIFATITLCVGMFVGPLLIAQLLDAIQHGRLSSEDGIWTLVIAYGISQLWSEIIGWRVVLYLVWTFETAMQRDLYQRIFEKLTHQTMFFHSSTFGGSLVSQTNKLTGAAERFWDMVIWSILPLIISLTGSIAVLSTLLLPYAIFLAIISLVFLSVVYFGSRPLVALNRIEAAASNKLSGQLADAMSNIMAIKASGGESQEQGSFEARVTTWRNASLAIMSGFLKVSTAYSTINTTLKIGAIAFAIYASQHNLVSVAAVYLIITYTGTVARELWNMNGIMRTYNSVIGNAREMTDVLKKDTTLVDTTDEELAISKGSLAIDKMTFTHDEGQGKTLFEDFSLQIPAGQKVGLVGSSGSGKTTLTKLLLRFADIDSGAITIDGQNIAHVTQASLRSQIAYVPQEPLLFHRTIRENIAYGTPHATDKDIERAAKQAGAYEFIKDLTEGFDTMVGERGVKLSGGQRQRIAIARAILKNAPILILDEATSALDSESEALIQKSLETLMQGRTSIVIAHRLSTIAKLDRIIVMDHGTIVEDGSHDALLKKKKGTYAQLWQRQSGGFIEE